MVCKNVDGLNNRKKRIALLKKIRKEADENSLGIVMIQEHNLKKQAALQFQTEARDKDVDLQVFISHIPSSDTRGGTAIIIPTNLIIPKSGTTRTATIQQMRENTIKSQSGRVTTTPFTLEGIQYSVTSAYANASEAHLRPTFFEHVLQQHLKGNTILGIDANCVPDERLDLKRESTTAYVNTGAAELEEIISSIPLIDVARETLGEEPYFTCTHRTRTGSLTYSRIDRIYVPHLNNVMWEHPSRPHDFLRGRGEEDKLDHSLVKVVITHNKDKRGRDVQRVNEKIYDDPQFTDKVNDTIKSFCALATRTGTGADPREAWADLKKTLYKQAMARTKKLNKTTAKEVKSLQTIRDTLKGRMDKGEADEQCRVQHSIVCRELRQASLIPSTLAATAEEIAYNVGKNNDVCSKAFFRKWLPRGQAQWIQETIRADWDDLANPQSIGPNATKAKEVAEAQTSYWSALFRRRNNDPQAEETCLQLLRDESKGGRVLKPTADRCDATISSEELEVIMNGLPIGKSPGPDGLPNKFYKMFAHLLAPILARVFNHSREQGSLPLGLSDGLIALLYKKKDRTDPRNYRPITLLNGDYKIMMRCLAHRMREAAAQFVSPSQTGFVPGAFIAENGMLLNLIQSFIDEENSEAYLLFLDMEKAFDRCSWDFLIKAATAVGLGPGFVSFIKLCYSYDTAPKRQLYVNGYFGPQFDLLSGVAQGCPLSPLLFLIITEPLSRLFGADNTMAGVRIHGVRHIISQYADDTTLILRPRDTDRSEQLLRIWEGATNMKENVDKREGLLLGSLARNPALAPHGIKPRGV